MSCSELSIPKLIRRVELFISSVIPIEDKIRDGLMSPDEQADPLETAIP